jgi:hypothetical protein
MRVSRRAPALVAATLTVMGALGGTVAPARADDPSKSVCRTAYEQGQRLRRAKKLLSARDEFVVCSRAPCPTVFQPECLRWLGEVQSEVPTVVVDVRRGTGVESSAADVLVDGAPFAKKIDGRAQPVDPGQHVFTVTLPDGKTHTQTSTVVEGVKAQRIVFDFAPRVVAPPPPPPEHGVSPWTYVLGGVTVAGLGSFGYFGLTGLHQRGQVIDCTQDCTQSDVDTARRSLLVADISLGVSVVALAGAITTYFLTRPPARSETP